MLWQNKIMAAPEMEMRIKKKSNKKTNQPNSNNNNKKKNQHKNPNMDLVSTYAVDNTTTSSSRPLPQSGGGE